MQIKLAVPTINLHKNVIVRTKRAKRQRIC